MVHYIGPICPSDIRSCAVLQTEPTSAQCRFSISAQCGQPLSDRYCLPYIVPIWDSDKPNPHRLTVDFRYRSNMSNWYQHACSLDLSWEKRRSMSCLSISWSLDNQHRDLCPTITHVCLKIYNMQGTSWWESKNSHQRVATILRPDGTCGIK